MPNTVSACIGATTESYIEGNRSMWTLLSHVSRENMWEEQKSKCEDTLQTDTPVLVCSHWLKLDLQRVKRASHSDEPTLASSNKESVCLVKYLQLCDGLLLGANGSQFASLWHLLGASSKSRAWCTNTHIIVCMVCLVLHNRSFVGAPC